MVDQETGLPFILYMGQLKTTAQMLEGIDLLLFDMQDVGAFLYLQHYHEIYY